MYQFSRAIYRELAPHIVDPPPGAGVASNHTAVSGARPQCRATTRKGAACQRVPLPRNGYCPSHQHLAETEDRELAAA